MNGEHRDGIRLTVVYADEHLIELQAIVSAGDWRGQASAYTVPADIDRFVGELENFAVGVANYAELVAGKDDGTGLVAIRLYRVDRAGHIAVHVRLATGKHKSDCRSEEIRRLSIEVATESNAIIEFSRSLRVLAHIQSGEAWLRIER